MAKANRAKSRNKRRTQRRRPARSAEFYKQFLPDPPPKREYPPCPISGEPIHDILTAIAHPETGQPANLESVIAQLSRRESLGPNERICYIGEGQFGVVHEDKTTSKNDITIVRRIDYENPKERQEWRRELSPGVSRDYTPEPEPLDRLYSPEEERAFPRFSRGSGSYMPRSG